MPLVYQQHINPSTKIAVWHITEMEPFFLSIVSMRTIVKHPHKRLQHLAGRYLLKELYPSFPLEVIAIADTRKPFLPDEKFHFSISHCGDFAAAIVSPKYRVGIDIEIPQEKIYGIKLKFLDSDELKIAENISLDFLQALTLCWSIKEAVFKWYSHGGVDFRQHINIQIITKKDDFYFATCRFTKESNQILQVTGFFINGNFLTWIVGEADGFIK